jgi:molecular chaperone DnaJ
MSDKRCYYEVLGIERTTPPDEVRKAYKREALKHHPDRNPNNPDAESNFKQINEAFQVLSDEDKRGVYDQFGHAGLEGGGGGGGNTGDMFSQMQDLFSEMFSGGFGGRSSRGRGGDLRVQQRISLVEAAFGCKRELIVQAPGACDECGGSGAEKGTKAEACSPCRGTGQVTSSRGFVMFSAPCARCQGRGVFIKSPCRPCSGGGVVAKARKVTVTFPAGIDAGQRLRVPGQGMAGPNSAGDLYVEIDVEDDPRFERDGADLVTRAHISLTDAALGAEIEVPALDPNEGVGVARLTLPPGTQPGHVVSLKGKGVPRLDGRGRGALVVEVKVDVPTRLSARAKELLRELERELGEDGVSASKKKSAAK